MRVVQGVFDYLIANKARRQQECLLFMKDVSVFPHAMSGRANRYNRWLRSLQQNQTSWESLPSN